LFTTGTSFTRRSLGAGGHLKQMTKKMQKVARPPTLKLRRLKEKVGCKQGIEISISFLKA
jgi:hypothetical protein